MAKKQNINSVNLTDAEVIEWIKLVKIAITNIYLNFKGNQGLILTEGDLECILFNELLKENLDGSENIFSKYYLDKPKAMSTRMVHSQVTWFKTSERSGFRVDLTIFKPENSYLKKHDDVAVWANKGFFHDGKALGVEIKFIRTHVKSKIEEMVKEDCNKLIKKLLPAKLDNISNGTYEKASSNNIAFIVIVGCKNEEIYKVALTVVEEYITKNKLAALNFLEFFIFSPENSKYLINKL